MNGLFRNDIRKEKEMANRNNKIVIEGAEIFFKNFSGKKDNFNPEGKRSFCVYVDDIADKLKADGWNVKMTKPRDEDSEPRPFLRVNVKFGDYPPNIFMVTEHNKTKLDEISVNNLDNAYILNADVIISPYHWEMNGKSGITAYLDTLYATIEEDPFAGKYADIGKRLDDNLPF